MKSTLILAFVLPLLEVVILVYWSPKLGLQRADSGAYPRGGKLALDA